MSSPKRISLRFKILAFLTLIPVIVLSIYLYMAIRIFIDDKLAFVFDSVRMVSKSVSVQSKTEFDSKFRVLRPIFQDYLNQYSFTSVSTEVFKGEPLLDFVGVYLYENGRYLPQNIMEKENQLFVQTVQALSNHAHSLVKAYTKGRYLIVNPADESFVLYERVIDPTKNKTFIFVTGYKSPEFSGIFKSSKNNLVFLVHDTGEILFGPSDFGYSSLNDYVPLQLQSENNLVAGSTSVAKSQQNKEVLVSTSPVSFSDLQVVVVAEQDQALIGVQVLIRKSILFFGILICSTIIISIFASSQLTGALTDLFTATKKVAEGNFDIKVKVNSGDEIGSLAESFNKMAEEVSRLLSETAEKARMESELKTAQTVQETLFPNPSAQIGDFKIAGYYEPASECGGDWWHYSQVGDKIYMWIGDATGHGAPAALITSAAKSAATIIERLNTTPSTALSLMNKAIYDVSKGRIMMTFFLACYDLKTKKLVYSNASHEPPFLIKKGEEVLKKKNLIPLNEVNNPRLGQSRDTSYSEVSVQLELHDSIVFYTDGLTDIRNKENEAWGERGFLKALVESGKDFPDPNTIVKRMQGSMADFRSKTPLVDDVTYFVCQCADTQV